MLNGDPAKNPPKVQTTKPRKKWFRVQFGLRAVLILILLVCIGSSVYRRYTAYMAIDAIQSKAGFVRPLPKATGWRRVFSNDVYKVYHLSFHNSFGVTDEDVVAITRLPWLRRLSLHRTAVTDRSAKYVAKLRHLEALSFQGTKITDEGLAELTELTQLKSLSLKETAITDAGLEQLADLTQMQELMLQNTPITSLKPLRKMSKLRRLETGRKMRDVSSLAHLRQASELEQLQLDYMPMGRRSIEALGPMTSLRELRIASAQLESAPNEMWQAFPRLEELTTNCLGEFSMVKHRRIRSLNIRGVPRSILLEDLPALEELQHPSRRLGDLSVRSCPNLKSLSIDAKHAVLEELPELQVLRIGDYGTLQFEALPSLVAVYFQSRELEKELVAKLTQSNGIRFMEFRSQLFEQGALEQLVAFPNLETLDLRWNLWGQDTARLLAKLPKLKTLRVGASNVTPEFLLEMSKSTTLESARVYATKLRPEECETLLQAPKLRSLTITCRPTGKSQRYETRHYEACDGGPSERTVTVKGRSFVRAL